jgi:hypothetical protein
MEAWQLEWRLLLVLLPVGPVAATMLLWPASGVLSDSFAAAESLGPILAAIAGYAAASWIEWRVLGSALSAAILPVYAGTFVTMHDQGLLADDGAECNSWCVLHSVLLWVLVLCELGAAKLRGASWLLVGGGALVCLSAGLLYRVGLLEQDGFDARDRETRYLLALFGAGELLAFLVARTLAALAEYKEGWFLLERGE